jgi:predicted site-specific integrase-resolvase
MNRRFNTLELSRKLGINRDTIRRWILAGKIPAGTLEGEGNTKRRVWSAFEVAKIIEFMNANPNRGRRVSR